MSTHLAETGYDPDLDYNLLVEAHRPAGPKKQSDEERVAIRESTKQLGWARRMMDQLCDKD